jgi:hypothetical protein
MDPNLQSAPQDSGVLANSINALSQVSAGIVEVARKFNPLGSSSSVDTTGQYPAAGGRRRRMRGGSNINIPILPGSYDAIVAPPAAPAPAAPAAPVAAAPVAMAPPAPAPAVKTGGSKRRRSRSHSGGKSKRTKKSKRSKSRSKSRNRK